MSTRIKIHQGTGRLTGSPLCNSCAHAFIVNGNENVICQWVHPNIQITKPVFDCNSYNNKALPSVRMMEQIAWELKTDGGRKMGFAPPKNRDSDTPVRSWDDD